MINDSHTMVKYFPEIKNRAQLQKCILKCEFLPLGGFSGIGGGKFSSYLSSLTAGSSSWCCCSKVGDVASGLSMFSAS